MSSESLRRARILVAVIVVGLLGGTAAAFALTEQLKLERSPVYRTHVGKLLGPDCHCGLATTPIRFVLRKPETLTVTIVGHEGDAAVVACGEGGLVLEEVEGVTGPLPVGARLG